MDLRQFEFTEDIIDRFREDRRIPVNFYREPRKIRIISPIFR